MMTDIRSMTKGCWLQIFQEQTSLLSSAWKNIETVLAYGHFFTYPLRLQMILAG